MRKDIKKSSYYVWFLGAQEAEGFRGAEYVTPVIASLVERESRVEPYKVTLQTSHKGIKIVQNVPLTEPSSKHKSPSKTEVVKHFVPHQAITCVHREDDIVACILLLFNPVTECPLHVHVYRCDSVETATILASQLQTLVDRPDNRKKLSEIEARLKGKVRGRDSESSGGSLSSGVSGHDKTAALYDSLAAELKEKLGTGPILLPPRDYDTVHRRKGDLSDIDSRRCLNASVVGRLAGGGQSPGSSGIGSDPSPDRENPRFLDQQSSSDEEWSVEQFKASGQKNWSRSEVSLPRARRQQNESIDSKISPSGVSSVGSSTSLSGQHRKPSFPLEENTMRGIQESTEEIPSQRWRRTAEERQRTPSPIQRSAKSLSNSLTARERFQDAKEKFLSLERTEQERMMQIRAERRAVHVPRVTDHTQGPVVPVFRPHLIRSSSQSKSNDDCDETMRASYSGLDEEPKHIDEMKFTPQVIPHVSKKANHVQDMYDHKKASYINERDSNDKLTEESLIRERAKSSHPTDSVYPIKEHSHQSRKDRDKNNEVEKLKYEYSHRRSPQVSMTGSFPDDIMDEMGARPKRQAKLFHEQERSIPLERYRSPPRIEPGYKQGMRRIYPSGNNPNIDNCHDVKYNHIESQHYSRRQNEQTEKKRRSMYESVEEERKRNSNELAKEFMKRSFKDQRSNSHGNFKEDPEHYPHSEREIGRSQDDITPRYRHSYVEPVSHSHPHIQRATSAMSRVGIAAIHPY